MNHVLIVSYDLNTPGKSYEPLLKLIKSYPGWARLGGSAYLIATDLEPVAVRDALQKTLDQNDKLYVGVSPAPSAWKGMPNDVSNWIVANQK